MSLIFARCGILQQLRHACYIQPLHADAAIQPRPIIAPYPPRQDAVTFATSRWPVPGLIKVVIIVLLFGVVLSLFGGLAFLFKDSEQPESKRALYALGIRITLAAALLLTVFYGFYTGQLRMGASAPWHQRSENLLEHLLENIDKEEQAHPDHVNEVPVPR